MGVSQAGTMTITYDSALMCVKDQDLETDMVCARYRFVSNSETWLSYSPCAAYQAVTFTPWKLMCMKDR